MTNLATAPASVVHADREAHGTILRTLEVTEKGKPVTLAFFQEHDGESVWVPLGSLVAPSA